MTDGVSNMMRREVMSRLGFEPRTLGLKVRCSGQAELPAHVVLMRWSEDVGRSVTSVTVTAGHELMIP